MRKALLHDDHFFVQDSNYKTLINTNEKKDGTVSGHTRFDRVSKQLQMDNKLKFAEDFKGNSLCIVCGSTWPEDEKMLINFINHSVSEVKFIIAPHKIEADKIERFQNKIVKKTILLSQVDQVDISQIGRASCRERV